MIMTSESSAQQPLHCCKLEKLSIGYSSKGSEIVVGCDLSATLNGGQLTCLLGANGVGKSTLLRTLSGFQPPLGGRMMIDGKDVDRMSNDERSRTIGVVLTEKPAGNQLTVRQLVALGRTPYTGFWGRCSEDDWRVVDEAVEHVGLTALSHRLVGTLSDGERQKAMIAKALAQQTPVILLDEPTAYLDYPGKVEMMLLLRQICRQMGRIVFLSTHDVEVALQLADRVWLMSRQQPMVIGSPEDLALEGHLANFFSPKSLLFNPLTGLFSIHLPTTHSVMVSSDETEPLTLLTKALLRHGVKVVEGCVDEALLSVRIEKRQFVLKRDKEKATAKTVAEVCEWVVSRLMG